MTAEPPPVPAGGESQPPALVYGEYPFHESFAIFDEADAQARAEEYDRVRNCRTRAEFLTLLPSLRFSWVTEEDLVWAEDELDSLEEPFNWNDDYPGAADGDWPPMPTANVLQGFDDPAWLEELFELDGVRVVDTIFNGEYAEIPPALEPDLRALLARHGIAARRDDDLIERLS